MPAQKPATAGEKTSDPQRFVLAHAGGDAGIAQFDCSQCSAMNDLLFIGSRESCGNAGCEYYIFKKTDAKSYTFVTTIFLHRVGFQFLKTKHHGFNDILSYHHMSASEGELAHFEFDGKQYEEGESEIIQSSEFDSRIKPEKVEEIYFSKDLERVPR
jgi:hypothetical protein